MVHVAADRIARVPVMRGAPHYSAGDGRRPLQAANTGHGPLPAGHPSGNPFHPAVPTPGPAHAPPAAHIAGPGAGGWSHPRYENRANGEYRPPAGQQFAHPGTPGQFGRPGVPGQLAHPGLPQQQFRPGQAVQPRGFGGGFQMPGRATPMVRAPAAHAAHAAPSGGNRRK
jgi:hypothetical protein